MLRRPVLADSRSGQDLSQREWSLMRLPRAVFGPKVVDLSQERLQRKKKWCAGLYMESRATSGG